MELWKPIDGFEGIYLISDKGRVKNKNTGKILKLQHDKNGYCVIGLHNHPIHVNRKVHRLVAKAFIPNPNGLPQVNHKDENKENNSVENLEWCTNKYNVNYGNHSLHAAQAQIGKKHTADHIAKIRNNAPSSKAVYMIDDKSGKIVKEFVSASEAARRIEGTATNVSYACRNGIRYKGMRWEYK